MVTVQQIVEDEIYPSLVEWEKTHYGFMIREFYVGQVKKYAQMILTVEPSDVKTVALVLQDLMENI